MIRVTALVSPKSRPKIAATRSNSARATKPQFSAPTMARAPATTSSFFISVSSLCSEFVKVTLQIRLENVKSLCKVCRMYVEWSFVESLMRIGELSRRTGVTPELLRAWEQRYQLLRPSRSSGGFRLYSSSDEARVRRTTALIAEGLSAGEAARLAATGSAVEQVSERPLVADLATRLQQALDAFDAAAAHGALDRLFSAVSVEFALAEVLIPYLHDLGARWAAGEATVAQEHFASNLVRSRLVGLAQDWGAGGSSTSVAACLPGEAHDLGLVMLGLLMARRGWQVTF